MVGLVGSCTLLLVEAPSGCGVVTALPWHEPIYESSPCAGGEGLRLEFVVAAVYSAATSCIPSPPFLRRMCTMTATTTTCMRKIPAVEAVQMAEIAAQFDILAAAHSGTAFTVAGFGGCCQCGWGKRNPHPDEWGELRRRAGLLRRRFARGQPLAGCREHCVPHAITAQVPVTPIGSVLFPIAERAVRTARTEQRLDGVRISELRIVCAALPISQFAQRHDPS